MASVRRLVPLRASFLVCFFLSLFLGARFGNVNLYVCFVVLVYEDVFECVLYRRIFCNTNLVLGLFLHIFYEIVIQIELLLLTSCICMVWIWLQWANVPTSGFRKGTFRSGILVYTRLM